MRYSLDALAAFSAAANTGSFSAAARELGKSQSSVSEAIANLEADLNVTLFDRSRRQPELTSVGETLLLHAREVLAANARLDLMANELSGGLETRLTMALSDTFQCESLERLLTGIGTRYPQLEFECMIAESHDIIDTVGSGRAHIGLLGAQSTYPSSLAYQLLPQSSEIGLYAGVNHPLAKQAIVTRADLAQTRELRINTFTQQHSPDRSGPLWSAPSYVMLVEMAALGFGWAELPVWLAERYGGKQLAPLPVAGWPRPIQVHAVWSQQRPLGRAGAWLLARLLE